MGVESVFDEDHLVPIALLDRSLVFFSRLDGCIYRADSNKNASVYEAVPIKPRGSLFCIPGQPFVYDLVHSHTSLLITEYRIDSSGFTSSGEWTHTAPGPDAYRLAALIPCAIDQTARIVFESASAENGCWIIKLGSGETSSLKPMAGLPECIFSNAYTLAKSSDNRWQVLDRDKNLLYRGEGSVVSITSNFAIVEDAAKTGSKFYAIGSGKQRVLTVAGGWSILSAAASDRVVVAYATHPKLGQTLFRTKPKELVFSHWKQACSRVKVFALGASTTPVLRRVGLALGSAWLSDSGHVPGIAKPRKDLVVEVTTLARLPCVKANRVNTGEMGLLVCLHGGPDSQELDDLRYGGIYREVIDAGWSTLAVNYPGSSGFGKSFQEQAWKAWDASVKITAKAVQEELSGGDYARVVILGASFGAWMALQLEKFIPVDGIVVISPVINLADHLRLHAQNDRDFRLWARERFGSIDQLVAPADGQALDCKAPVVAITPKNDEVIQPYQTATAIQTAQKLGRPWRAVGAPGRHYPKDSKEAALRWAILFQAITLGWPAYGPDFARLSASPAF